MGGALPPSQVQLSDTPLPPYRFQSSISTSPYSRRPLCKFVYCSSVQVIMGSNPVTFSSVRTVSVIFRNSPDTFHLSVRTVIVILGNCPDTIHSVRTVSVVFRNSPDSFHLSVQTVLAILENSPDTLHSVRTVSGIFRNSPDTLKSVSH